VAEPPPKTSARPRPSKGPAGLDEVERALSVLDGRHPEYERTRRESVEAASAQRSAQRAAHAREVRKRVLRVLAVVVAVGALAAGAWSVRGALVRSSAIAAGLDVASARFTKSGFEVLASSGIRAPHTLEVDVGDGRCVVALTSAAWEMTVTHAASELHGTGSIGWCACAPEHVVVKAPASAALDEGLRVVDIDARTMGGREGWASLADAQPASFGPGGDTCSEDALVAWIASGRFPKVPYDTSWLDHDRALARAGFRAVAGSPAGRRFAVVQPDKESCLYALRTEGHGDDLALTTMDGAQLARGSRIVWCDPSARSVTVRSDGTGPVLVVSVAGNTVGGMGGTLERVGATDVATWIAPEALAWDASALLRASALPDVATVAPGDEAPFARARFVGLSMSGTDAFAVPGGSSAKDEPVCSEGPGLARVCAQAAARSWSPIPGKPLGVAAAPLPYWLTVFESQRDRRALGAQLALLRHARRLTGEGFELTLFSGVTELAGGRVEVTGHAGKDAVVVVGIGATEPYTFPFRDAPPPRPHEDDWLVLPLASDGHVTLTAYPAPTGAEKQRRILVFRGKLGK
jgi:hypothetical protein